MFSGDLNGKYNYHASNLVPNSGRVVSSRSYGSGRSYASSRSYGSGTSYYGVGRSYYGRGRSYYGRGNGRSYSDLRGLGKRTAMYSYVLEEETSF